jgi:hypothetical protein
MLKSYNKIDLNVIFGERMIFLYLILDWNFYASYQKMQGLSGVPGYDFLASVFIIDLNIEAVLIL